MSVMGVESAFTIMFGCFMVGGFGYPETSNLIMSEICRLQMSRWDLRLCLLETPWSPQEAGPLGWNLQLRGWMQGWEIRGLLRVSEPF